jgi:hypothetical protein
MRYEDKVAVAAYMAFLAVLVFWVLDRQVLGIGLRRLYEGRPA